MRQGVRSGQVVRLRYVQTWVRNGRTYRYLRMPGRKKVRLPDLPPDHPEFIRAYVEALESAPAIKRSRRFPPGTIGALVEATIACERFRALAPDYQRIIRKHLDEIADKAGEAPYAGLRPRHIRASIAKLAPHAASKRMKAWRFMLRFAVDAGLMDDDPSQGIRPPRPEKSGGHVPWAPDEIAAFRAHWPIGSPQRAVFELLHWTGARVSDAVRLGPQMIDRDGVLTFRQEKTGELAYVPWTCSLPSWASGMESDRRLAITAMPAGHMTWLVSSHGRPRSKKALGTFIRKAAESAGVFGKSAHGLRKTRAVALAEAGATPHQIAAWTGHKTLAEVTHYTERADRRRAVMGSDNCLHLPTDVSTGQKMA